MAKFNPGMITSGIVAQPLRVLWYGQEGVGKAQPLDAMVLTPNGFVPMGELAVGDRVIGGDGKPCTVTAVFPQGRLEVFRVSFGDGTETRCCNDHLWVAKHMKRWPYNRWEVLPLKDIRADMMDEKWPDTGNFSVPTVGHVEYDQILAELPVDPWLLGFALGDGCFPRDGSLNITKPEDDLLDRVASLVPDGDEAVRFANTGGVAAVRIRSKGRSRSAMHTALATMGLIGTESHQRFVPLPYMRASASDRLRLLCGLMDSDGSVTGSGSQVEFSTTSSRLRDDVVELARGLGGIVTVRERVTHYTYRGERKAGRVSWRMLIGFKNGTVPVSSSKHLAKWTGDCTKRKAFVGAEPIGEAECQCIMVDSPDHTYVTDEFIVTHNTSAAASAPRPLLVGTEDGSAHVNVARVTPSSWQGKDDSLLSIVEWFCTADASDYQTIVIDTADMAERLCIDYVCQRDNDTPEPTKKYNRTTWVDGKAMLDGYGYGAGPKVVESEFLALLAALDRARRARGVHVVFTAHSDVAREKNAGGDDYGIIAPRLIKQVREQLAAWCDAVLYCEYSRTEIKAAEKDRAGRAIGKAKVISDGERIVHTQRGGAFIAKNRFELPPVIELGWEPLVAHAEKAYGNPAEQSARLRAEIEALAMGLPEERRAKVAAAVEKNKAGVLALVEIKGRVQSALLSTTPTSAA